MKEVTKFPHDLLLKELNTKGNIVMLKRTTTVAVNSLFISLGQTSVSRDSVKVIAFSRTRVDPSWFAAEAFMGEEIFIL